jgi:hypothetical protein
MSADPLPPEKTGTTDMNLQSATSTDLTTALPTGILPEPPAVEAKRQPVKRLVRKKPETAPAITATPSVIVETLIEVLGGPAPVAPEKSKKTRKPRTAKTAAVARPARHRAKQGDATRNQISKVWLSGHEIDRIDKVRDEHSRGEWIRKTILRVAGEENLPVVDSALQDDSFQPRTVVVNFRLTLDELKLVDRARGRQARCTWMREAVLRVAYPESEKRAA